jgi:hypothetical protein
MILKVHLQGAVSYAVGDEIWQEPLADVICAEADMIAGYADAEAFGNATRDVLRARVITEMTAALVSPGDSYLAPDRVLYTLHDDGGPATGADTDTLTSMRSGPAHPVVDEVVRFETLPVHQGGTRRAIVRWSNGSEGIALAWYPDEILVSEGDHGNSRLMSPRAEMHRAAGSVRAPRGT